jgi:hypothetical protein
MSAIGDALRQKLREVSKGEPNTWGFVAMFMEMIAEAERSIKDAAPQAEQIGDVKGPRNEGSPADAAPIDSSVKPSAWD